ncbi:MAG: hypothetical protein AB1497_09585 [Bacillota bacterium]
MIKPGEHEPLAREFGTGVKDGIPVAVSILAYGLVFGVLARQSGLSWLETVVMSFGYARDPRSSQRSA